MLFEVSRIKYSSIGHMDTLFTAEYGRAIKGSPDETHKVLSYLGSLPDSTVVFSGREDTRRNLSLGNRWLNHYT